MASAPDNRFDSATVLAILLAATEDILTGPFEAPEPRGPELPPGVTAGGYPEEMFLGLVEEAKHRIECGICYNILKNTRRCSNEHKFCTTCIYAWTTTGGAGNDKCPVCRTKGFYVKDPALDEQIGKERVKCVNESCKWQGLLKDFQYHRHGYDMHPKQEAEINALNKIGVGYLLNRQNDSRNTLEDILVPGSQSRHRADGISPFASDTVPTAEESDHEDDENDNALPHIFGFPHLSSGFNPRGEAERSNRRRRHQRMTHQLQEGRERLANLMDIFNQQLLVRRANILALQQEREQRRRQQLAEVRHIGQRLEDVSSNLMSLLTDMDGQLDDSRAYINNQRSETQRANDLLRQPLRQSSLRRDENLTAEESQRLNEILDESQESSPRNPFRISVDHTPNLNSGARFRASQAQNDTSQNQNSPRGGHLVPLSNSPREPTGNSRGSHPSRVSRSPVAPAPLSMDNAPSSLNTPNVLRTVNRNTDIRSNTETSSINASRFQERIQRSSPDNIIHRPSSRSRRSIDSRPSSATPSRLPTSNPTNTTSSLPGPPPSSTAQRVLDTMSSQEPQSPSRNPYRTVVNRVPSARSQTGQSTEIHSGVRIPPNTESSSRPTMHVDTSPRRRVVLPSSDPSQVNDQRFGTLSRSLDRGQSGARLNGSQDSSGSRNHSMSPRRRLRRSQTTRNNLQGN
ncbi:unnamed protein product [Owenia fusiformis]|uniref:RING-type domain-containing protein n=1 Tax=Owenia fusiformis TaxID=6347 RepID=A0A8S4NR74_OWEFU|nr:unnamed protein product [Owenia fusiformis]